MKQAFSTFLIIATIGLMAGGLTSCRKDTENIDIKTYDQQQIQAYISSHNLTGYTRDLTGGDTTGIYYKITKQGTGTALDYPDLVFYVYTATSLDGKYTLSDTAVNHAYNYVGHLTPPGLQLAIKNLLKYRGTQAHVIIPSRLAYGATGQGTGSTRLPGNESLDYYINMVDPSQQAAYDDLVIRNYMTTNGLSGFTKTASGLYYKITQQGTGKSVPTPNSTIGVQFNGRLMNGVIFDYYTASDSSASPRDYAEIPKGWQEGFKNVTKGTNLSLIIPSALGYGLTPSSPYGFSVSSPGPNSCLYYDFTIESITN
ncbi:FKBP-type peptidyl-prolyl cis-trans isomerase [Mucilaginibacter ginkgonis]|uniref:Peptidyl-prolyl cis-trans isomerase n=1 Tax=Mucilaginibacter ginkgonis TaxID=2682091 RepID=A0A6I4IMU0_9SPHI|nr:FKBP-type peptidyl-prolyl cis-trans isomerase [Mucilaginibacter ginkgonis]QQL50095.1 FKBP-type peptidyl-prolyl cis-trans isomerase [Mucilaginibacter ginkgonis]